VGAEGRRANYGFRVERGFEQEVRYIASFIGKYVEVDAHVKETIEQYVLGKCLRKAGQSAVVM